MDQLARALAQIERRLVADDPVLTEAFALWEERCAEASRSAATTEDPRWLVRVLGALLGAAVAISWWPRSPGWW